MKKIQFKRALSSRWNELNPILATGEPGFERDTGKLKIGNGTTAWNDLSYLSGSGGTPIVLENIDDRVAELLVPGSGISINYNDIDDELTISADTNSVVVGQGGLSSQVGEISQSYGHNNWPGDAQVRHVVSRTTTTPGTINILDILNLTPSSCTVTIMVTGTPIPLNGEKRSAISRIYRGTIHTKGFSRSLGGSGLLADPIWQDGDFIVENYDYRGNARVGSKTASEGNTVYFSLRNSLYPSLSLANVSLRIAVAHAHAPANWIVSVWATQLSETDPSNIEHITTITEELITMGSGSSGQGTGLAGV